VLEIPQSAQAALRRNFCPSSKLLVFVLHSFLPEYQGPLTHRSKRGSVLTGDLWMLAA
jgi:hypothetical protein